MATRRSATGRDPSGTGVAGLPTVPASGIAAPAPARTPSAEELDLRNRLKSGHRRPGGPPLVGDVDTAAAMEALRNEVLAEPTDPRNRRGRT